MVCVVIKHLLPLYKHSFVLSSMVVHCLYIRYDFFVKYPVNLRDFLSLGITGLLLECGVRESSVIKTPVRYLYAL